jgi:hypothetical protein
VSVPADVPKRPDFEAVFRAIAAREATRGPCSRAAGGDHAVDADDLTRLARYGGRTHCQLCGLELRLVQRHKIDLALSMVNLERQWAGLPPLTPMHRAFLRAVLGGRCPIVTATQELRAFEQYAELVELAASVDGNAPSA